jgi:hypothetical protein
MTAEPGALAARMDQIRRRLSMRNYTDSAALLAAVERITALADQWHGERGSDYSATATLASRLREVLAEELLGEGEGDG